MTWRELVEWSAYDEMEAQDALERKSAQLNDAALQQALSRR